MARIRITGVALPWFGVSWEYGDSDRDVARRVLTFLEDRRVLYIEIPKQVFDYASASALEIRQMLTQELSSGSVGKELAERLRIIRAALRKFMDAVDEILRREWSGQITGYERRDEQILALGEMRGHVNPILAELAIAYEIEVEEDLAAALQPLEPSSEN